MPEISVIMPVHNGEKYLREAVESILTQTFSDFELIVVDDGSTDSTADIIKSISDDRIVYLKNDRNIGISDTLNKGILSSRGKYIARMDADDISLPSRLEKQIDYMKQNPDVSVLGCAVEIFGEGINGSVRTFSSTPDEIKIDIIFATPFVHPTLMFERRVFDHELYDGNFNGAEDYELWIRLACKYRMATLNEPLLKYRKHMNQVTNNYSKDYLEKLKNLKLSQAKSFDIEYTSDEFDAFFEYCISGGMKQKEGISKLCSFLSKVSRCAYIETPSQKRIFNATTKNILTKLLLMNRGNIKDSIYIKNMFADFSIFAFYIEKVKRLIKNVR